MRDFDEWFRDLEGINTDSARLAPDRREGPGPDPLTAPSWPKRIAIIVTAFALFAVATGYFTLRMVGRGPAGIGSDGTSQVTISCSTAGASASAPVVKLDADGVHLAVTTDGSSNSLRIRDAERDRDVALLGISGLPRSWDGLRYLPVGAMEFSCVNLPAGPMNSTDVFTLPAVGSAAIVEVIDPDGFLPQLEDRASCGEPLPELASGVGADSPLGVPPSGTFLVNAYVDDSRMGDVYEVDVANRNVTPIAVGPGEVWAGGWSADGMKIALEIPDADDDPSAIDASREDGEIYIANADGTQLTKLTDNHATDHIARWVPGADRVSFASNRDGVTTLFSMATDGSQVVPLTPGYEADAHAWSPDGTKLAFIGHRDDPAQGCRTSSDLFVLDTLTGAISQITDDEFWEQHPAWSPNGTRIALMVSDQDDVRWDVAVMDADGSDLLRLTDFPGYDGYPVWSPDGSLIAFSSTRGREVMDDGTQAGSSIYVMNQDGSGVKAILSLADLGLSDPHEMFLAGWAT